MDLIRALLVYMSLLLSSSAVTSPVLTPVPADFATPTPIVTTTVAPTRSPAPTLVPTATPAPLATLYMGDRGAAVRTMQQRLKDLGYLTGNVDGIFGQQTRRAVERFQHYNSLSVDGIAGPKTLNKLYYDRNVIRNPVDVATPRPVSANVPVYYYTTRGVLLGSDTVVALPGSTIIVPNPARVPLNHTLISPSRVTVQVDTQGRANPASVYFTYQSNAELTPVTVPIFYRSDLNQLLATDFVTVPIGQSVVVRPNAAKVPSGYSLITSGALTLSISSRGVPTPNVLTFFYRQNAPVQATVPVLYRDTNGALIGSETKSYTAGTYTVTANDAAVPSGYTLQGSRTQQVTVSAAGAASPSVITFTYAPNVVTVSVPVEYVDQVSGTVIHSDTFSARTGSNTVTANDSFAPGYTLVSARQVAVSVSNAGQATPAKVTFTYKRVISVPVEVHLLLEGGGMLGGYSIQLGEGSHTIVPNDAFLSGYTLLDGPSKTVTVDGAGTATPAIVTFTYRKDQQPTTPPATPAPATDTPAPATTAPEVSAAVTLWYKDTDGGLRGGDVINLAPGTHQVSPTMTELGDLVLQGPKTQTVTVSAQGVAKPAELTFTYAKAAPPPQPPQPLPPAEAKVEVQYVDQATGAAVATESFTYTEGTYTITANDALMPGFVRQEEATVAVTVNVDGAASPNPVVFNYAKEELPPPAPVEAVVEVHYIDQATGGMIGAEQLTLGEGQHTITANDSGYAGYVRQGDATVTVTVNADGSASPSPVIFNYLKEEAPPPAPIEVQVEVQYKDQATDTVVTSESFAYTEGTHTVNANDALMPGFVRQGEAAATVTVAAGGTASPNPVVFNYVKEELPPPAPVQAVVEVHYIDQTTGGMIGAEQLTLGEGQHTVTANDGGYAGYVRQGEATITVTVNADGSASPSPVIFNYAKEEAPPPAPEEAPPAPQVSLPQLNYTDATVPEGSYAVYTGPGETYYQTDAETPFTGGAVRLYGSVNAGQGDWALIAYDLGGGNYRMGYVALATLEGITANPVHLAAEALTLTGNATLTEDPYGNNQMLSAGLTAGAGVKALAALDNWVYVEVADLSGSGQPARGLIPKASLGI